MIRAGTLAGMRARFGVAVLLIALLSCGAEAKQKDIVIMKNGDRLSGEIKELDSGVLYIRVDYISGSVGLDWKQVEKAQSGRLYEITLQNGDHYDGTIEKLSDSEGTGKDVVISMRDTSIRVPASNVVQVRRKKESTWRQLTGSISFGASFTSGNNVTALNTDASVAYPARTWAAGASYTSSFSGQYGSSQTNLEELQAGYEHYLNRNSFVLGISDFLHSSQQELNLRTTFGAAYGRYVKRTNEHSLRWFGGTVYTHEAFESTTAQPTDQNAEALLGGQYELYRFDRYTLQSQLLVYPGLSDYGRVRLTTKSSLNVKLRNNFFLTFTFWDNYDSKPPLRFAKRNELGVSTSVGWTF
jgi:putative salt-induced outer membrane protein YdiY